MLNAYLWWGSRPSNCRFGQMAAEFATKQCKNYPDYLVVVSVCFVADTLDARLTCGCVRHISYMRNPNVVWVFYNEHVLRAAALRSPPFTLDSPHLWGCNAAWMINPLEMLFFRQASKPPLFSRFNCAQATLCTHRKIRRSARRPIYTSYIQGNY